MTTTAGSGTGPRGTSGPAADRRRALRTPALLVAALVLGRGAVYVVQGARLILDDHIYLYSRRFEGLLEISPAFRLTNRPGAWLTQTVVYATGGEHPLALFALVTAINLAAALALLWAVAHFFRGPAPLLVAALWVLVPNHSTLTVWAASAQGPLALALCFLGVGLLARGRWVVALLLLGASLLTYELAVAICFAAVVLVGTRVAPPIDAGPARAIRPWQRATMVAVLAAVVLWMSRNPTLPLEVGAPNPLGVWSAHVGYGLLAGEPGSTLLLRALELGTAAGVVLVAVAWVRGDRDRDRGPVLALAGVVVMALGLCLVVAAPGGLYGLTNRLYGASSVGTAMIWAGIGVAAWHRARSPAVAGAAVLVALAVFGQVVALRSAHQAGADVDALVAAIAARPDATTAQFVIAPQPKRNGFYAIDHWFALYPYKRAFPESTGSLRVAERTDDLDVRPGEVVLSWDEVLGR